ncbi:MAG: hypothetical protein BRC25_02170 [Parcubacteria group bacterium SW_6_46_9]|nr:MAG: hypothetical protein BRC25_02170 [Parcubacteria group bacterium SW_6_46_9]
MPKTIYKVSVVVFILSVIALTFFAVLSIWDVFGEDVFWKSIATVATIGGASGLVMGAAKFLDGRYGDKTEASESRVESEQGDY